MFLLQQWDKSIDYSDQTLEEAKNKEKSLVNYFAEVSLRVKGLTWLGRPTKPGHAEMEFASSLAARQARVHAALLDNFNTPGAMEELMGVVADTHR
jgi:cysteinyl-tRNA synthetase